MEVCPNDIFSEKADQTAKISGAPCDDGLSNCGRTEDGPSGFTKTRCAKLHKFCTKKTAADVWDGYMLPEMFPKGAKELHILFVATY